MAEAQEPAGRLEKRTAAWGGTALLLLLFALPAWMAVTRYADLDRSRDTQARDGWEAILARPLPHGAVLVSDDRNDMMPLWYFQYVEKVRPDLLGLFPLITPEYATLGQVLDLALSTGRPVYLIKKMPGIEIKVAVGAENGLWRVYGPAAGEAAHPLDVSLEGAVALVGYDRTPLHPRPGHTLRVALYWQALRPLDTEYHTFVHLVDGKGRKVAQSDRQPGGVYYPSTLWQPGERLRDEHRLTLPADLPPGKYRLLAGMYAFADDGSLLPLGEPVPLAPVKVLSVEE